MGIVMQMMGTCLKTNCIRRECIPHTMERGYKQVEQVFISPCYLVHEKKSEFVHSNIQYQLMQWSRVIYPPIPALWLLLLSW